MAKKAYLIKCKLKEKRKWKVNNKTVPKKQQGEDTPFILGLATGESDPSAP